MIAVSSEPQGAAVLVDGVYMEATPCNVFVPAGRRSIELSLPGFDTKKTDMVVRGKLFASSMFPRKSSLHTTLETRDTIKSFINEASEYAAWSFIGEPSIAYQIPMSLSEGTYRLAYSAADPATLKSMDDTITASARFAVTRAALRDLVRAKTILDNKGLSPSPVSLLKSAEDIISFLGENQHAALWLASVLSGETQSALVGSQWFYEASAGGVATHTRTGAANAGGLNIANLLNFRALEAGVINTGYNFPAGTSVSSFYICELTVSGPAWERFLEEQPRWKPENLSALLNEGSVTEDYLNVPQLPGSPTEGVSGISWFAAGAFCEWLSSYLPPGLSSWEVRLPTEAEWEYAVKNISPIGTGRFWEWCEDPYVPLSFLSAPSQAAEALASPERSLRGGSWINAPGTVNAETRGSLSPSHCSPFVSFRPVIAPKRNR